MVATINPLKSMPYNIVDREALHVSGIRCCLLEGE